MAASHYFFLTVIGKGGHAGHVSDAVDPIMISAAIIQAVQAMQTREIEALEPTAIIFTKISAGCNTTTVPETAEMQGSIRFLSTDGRKIKKAFERVIGHICKAHRADYQLSYKVGNELVSNDLEMTKIARQAALECLGDSEFLSSGYRSMGGEDFSEFIRTVPGVFYFIGSGNRKKKTDYQHHHPCFDLDEDALSIGTEMHVRVALKYFNLI
jgi:amidohydrolase